MHTEEEHRGKGLAVMLGWELLRRQHVITSSDEQEKEEGIALGGDVNSAGADSGEETFTWAHADVSKDNIPSRRVMEKLGGKPMWMVMWTEVDMAEMLALQ